MASALAGSGITQLIIRDGGSRGVNRLELTLGLLAGPATLVGDKGQSLIVPRSMRQLQRSRPLEQYSGSIRDENWVPDKLLSRRQS